MNDLKKYMLQMSSLLQEEYDRIQTRAKEDPGTAGDSGEENWANFFRQWLPSSYHIVTKGRIMDVDGNCSPQIDVLILSPDYPPFLLKKKEYLAGGVIAAFECKLTLRLDHIYAAMNTAKIVSNLSTAHMEIHNMTPYDYLHSNIIYGLVAHSHPWEISDKLYGKIDKAISKGGKKAKITSPKELIDLICIADFCTWGSMKHLNLKGKTKESLILTSMSAFKGEYLGSEDFKKKAEGFSPLGVLMSRLIRRMAWKDYSLRNIASYFQRVQMEGTGQGSIEGYSSINKLIELYSLDVIEKQKEYCLKKNNKYIVWDEWGDHFY
jgi:hypothetical protein